MSPYARGGVTGVGIITALAGLVELASVFVSRGRRRDPDPSGTAPGPSVDAATDTSERLP